MVGTTRRQSIDDVASVLFRAHGYAGTSVRDIARALDIRGASLYAHVTSKQDVLWSIVERMATRFEAAADAVETADPGATLGAAHSLAALVRAHVAVVTEDIGRAGVFVHEWRALQGERRAAAVRRRDDYEARFRRVIERGVRDGTFRPVDAVASAAYILTALNGLVTWYEPGSRLSAAAIAEQFVDLSLRAVVAPGVRA